MSGAVGARVEGRLLLCMEACARRRCLTRRACVALRWYACSVLRAPPCCRVPTRVQGPARVHRTGWGWGSTCESIGGSLEAPVVGRSRRATPSTLAPLAGPTAGSYEPPNLRDGRCEGQKSRFRPFGSKEIRSSSPRRFPRPRSTHVGSPQRQCMRGSAPIGCFRPSEALLQAPVSRCASSSQQSATSISSGRLRCC